MLLYSILPILNCLGKVVLPPTPGQVVTISVEAGIVTVLAVEAGTVKLFNIS